MNRAVAIGVGVTALAGVGAGVYFATKPSVAGAISGKDTSGPLGTPAGTTPAQIAAAQAAGAAAAAQAHDIATRALAARRDLTWWDYLTSGQAVRDATKELHDANPLGSISDGMAAAAALAQQILDVAKWVGIALLVFVGFVILMWILAVGIGLHFAEDILKVIAPALAGVTVVV